MLYTIKLDKMRCKPSLLNVLVFAFATFFLTYCSPVESVKEVSEDPQTPTREYYQLKEYSFATESQELATDDYLENAFLPALKRQGIENIGVFKSRITEEDTIQRTFVLIPFTSLAQFGGVEDKLAQDQVYQAAGGEYLEASHENPPYQRISSTVLRAFSDMPMMNPSVVEGPRAERIYELRSYESSNETYYINKVDMFNAGGEIKLFERLDFNAVFYAEVLSGPQMPNLIYMTTFPNMEDRDEHWKAFVDAPEWKEMSSLPKYQNNVSAADIYLLYPTEYSDY